LPVTSLQFFPLPPQKQIFKQASSILDCCFNESSSVLLKKHIVLLDKFFQLC
jgi:hypothetical protein